MHTLPFLRKGSHGEALKKEWKDDQPLPMGEGGAVRALSNPELVALKDSFHAGNSHQTLVCLSRISTESSTPHLVLQENRLEGMGRKLWTTNTGKSAQAEPLPGQADNFYTENSPKFPESWPEKGTLPVIIRNTSRVPAQFKLLALDEMVASFWKIAAHCRAQIGVMKLDVDKAEADDKPDRKKYLQEKIESYEQQLEKARRLARNVPVSIVYCDSDEAARDKALSKREEVELFREYCSLTGWQRLVIIGTKRDELRNSRVGCTPQHVADALSKVVWSAGNVPTAPVVEKVVAIWNRLGQDDQVKAMFLTGQAYYGRDSPFDEYSKVTLMVNACKSNADLLWCAQTMLFERVIGKRKENYSKAELEKKNSCMHVAMLRKKVVDGVLASTLQPGIELLESLKAGKPHVVPELTALKTLKNQFVSAQVYYEAGRENQPQPAGVPDQWQQSLPPWASIRARRLLRNVMEGRRDASLSGLLVSPPKGGFQSIRYEHISGLKDFEEDIDALKKQHHEWSEEHQDRKSVTEPQGAPKEDKDGGVSPPKMPEGGVSPPDTEAIQKVREELSGLAKETRSAYVSMVLLSDTVLGARRNIESSAAYKRASAGNQKHRVVFMYIVGASWDQKRWKSHDTYDRRGSRAVALWKEDFQQFVDTVNPLITAENENYAVIFPGAAKRTGAGLAVMAGLAIETQMLEIFRKTTDAKSWKVNRIVMAYDRATGMKERGIFGRSQQAALFLYRGTWPNKMAGDARDNFGGTVSEDIWYNVPRFDPDSVVTLPYAIKEAIFQDTAWASNSAKEAEQDAEQHQKDIEAGQEEDECMTPVTKGKKSKKEAKTDSKKKDKKEAKTDSKKKDKKEAKTESKKSTKKDKAESKKDANKGKKTGKKAKPAGKSKSKATSSKNTKKKDKAVSVQSTLKQPEYEHAAGVDLKDQEVLCHHDLHPKVYEQAMKEWEARAVVLWTLGQGIGAAAAARMELPTLTFALSDVHEAFATYAIDSSIAHRLQVEDPSLRKRLAKVLADDGASDADSTAPATKKKKAKEDKKDKKEKEKDEEEEDDEEEDDDEEEEGSGSSSSSSS